jgi:hypothetical protein
MLGILATLAFHPAVALFGCLAFFVPGALFLLYWQSHHRPATLAGVITFMVALLVFGGIGAYRVYDYYSGPTHPNSTASRIPVDLARWVIARAVTADGFTVTAKLADPDAGAGELLVTPAGTDAAPLAVQPAGAPSPGAGVARYIVTGMRPSTRYSYAIRRDGHVDEGRRGQVTTLPAGPASFAVAFAACARVESNGRVFDRIREAQPLLYINTGDFHYQNIRENDPGAIREAYDRSLGTPGFPVFHAGALDRRGSVKGGPYSEGTFPGGGQFGLLEVTDDGGTEIGITFTGLTWQGTELIRYSRTFPVQGK